jgi:hypothetical protein
LLQKNLHFLFACAKLASEHTGGFPMIDTAYFAGGCFWCITPAFDMTPGVRKVVSGYSGGAEDVYREVT